MFYPLYDSYHTIIIHPVINIVCQLTDAFSVASWTESLVLIHFFHNIPQFQPRNCVTFLVQHGIFIMWDQCRSETFTVNFRCTDSFFLQLTDLRCPIGMVNTVLWLFKGRHQCHTVLNVYTSSRVPALVLLLFCAGTATIMFMLSRFSSASVSCNLL